MNWQPKKVIGVMMLKMTVRKKPRVPIKNRKKQVEYMRYLNLVLSQKATIKPPKSIKVANAIVIP